MKDKIIIIVGPTAVGKTSLGIELAHKINGEIISGDSMQIYKELDIGTAKVTQEEKDGISHHLIDLKDASENYSASDFQVDVRQKIEEITSRGKIPIVVGGTGLYIESLIYDVSHGGEADPDYAYRSKLEDLANKHGSIHVWEKLKTIDPPAAEKIHPNNLVRVIRALEVYHQTGKLFSDYQAERQPKEMLYDTYIIGLNTNRKLLYDRINNRVDRMIDQGLLDEVRWLDQNTQADAQSRRGIGYRELLTYIKGEISFDEAVANIKQNSRHYAKRQLTWFNNRTPVNGWYDLILEPDSIEDIVEKVSTFLKGADDESRDT